MAFDPLHLGKGSESDKIGKGEQAKVNNLRASSPPQRRRPPDALTSIITGLISSTK